MTEAVWSFAPVKTIRMFGGMVIANGSKASTKTTAMCGISDLKTFKTTVPYSSLRGKTPWRLQVRGESGGQGS